MVQIGRGLVHFSRNEGVRGVIGIVHVPMREIREDVVDEIVILNQQLTRCAVSCGLDWLYPLSQRAVDRNA